MKKCEVCGSSMFPITDETTINSQTDEVERVLVWYCHNCKKVFDMNEEEQIECQAKILHREK